MILKNLNNKIESSETLFKAWEKTIEVQQHFNNIELQIRNYALTFFTAILASIGYLIKEKINFEVHGYIIPASAIGSLIGVVIMSAFYFMDKYWYHALLKGAVLHGLALEKKLQEDYPEISLTTTIGKTSHVKIIGIEFKSDDKYYLFYYPLIIIFYAFYFILLR